MQWLELDTLGSPLACYHVTNESDYISWYDFTKKSTVRLDAIQSVPLMLMLDVMKGLMQALKDNQALRFAVVTGCLKIAKESIFTGTNNFVSDTITNSRLNEYFGFVQSEVDLLLKDADLTTQAENIKKWYECSASAYHKLP